MRNGATVLSFPIDRRMDLVRSMVGELMALNGEKADLYWRETARKLLSDRVEAGRTLDGARHEVRNFFLSVQTEMRRRIDAQSQSISA